MSKLVDGLIPAGQECPWKKQCRFAHLEMCHHRGTQHEVPFSCALARGFDLVDQKQPNRYNNRIN
jgi:hypothetical protein